MIKIFVCSKYGGEEENLRKAREYCREVYNRGHLPFAPHLFFPQFLKESDEREREAGIRLGLQMLESCDEMWVVGEEISGGMGIEIGFAEAKHIPIRKFKGGFRR